MLLMVTAGQTYVYVLPQSQMALAVSVGIYIGGLLTLLDFALPRMSYDAGGIGLTLPPLRRAHKRPTP